MTSSAPRNIVGPPAAIITVVVALVLLVVVPVWIAVPVGLVVGILVFVLVRQKALAVALRELRSREIADCERSSLDSVVEGLCLSNGFAAPRVSVAELYSPDIAVVGRGSADAELVITLGALTDLSRLELEALVARALCLLGPELETATLLTAAGRLLGRGPFARRYISRYTDADVVVTADLEGVRLTRYPPALASAMAKAKAVGGVPDVSTTNHLWLFGPGSRNDGARPPLEQRIDTLQEL